MSTLFARVARPGAQDLVRHVTIVRHAAARGPVGRIYAQVERDFGVLAPPVILHSPAPDVMAACWLMLRETLVSGGTVDRAAKEAVASVVSLANRCPFCVDVHGMTLYGLVRGADAAAVMDGRLDSLRDPRIRSVAVWARDLAVRRADRRPVPFPAGHAAEMIGTAVVFHYINRMVNVFLADSPLPPGLPGRVRARAVPVLGRYLRRIVLKHRAPGTSLPLLPPAPLPADLGWAAGSPPVSGAFARAAAAIDAAGERSVPAQVRELVRAEVARWDGGQPGREAGWAADAASALPKADRPAGRLALLTALASHRVGDSAVADFRRERPGDAALVELTSWAAFTAARRIAAGAHESPRPAARPE